MNLLLDVLVAAFVIALIVGPLYSLSSGNTLRCGHSLERKEAYHLAWSLIERYRGEGLPVLLRWARLDRGRYILDDAHLRDPFLDETLHLDRLEARGTVLTTRVRFIRDWQGMKGLARLESHVEVTREGRTYRTGAVRLFLTAHGATDLR